MTESTQQIIDKYYPEGSRLRDIYIRHCQSVADLALKINQDLKLGLDPVKVEDGAMLHDIGIVFTDAPGIDCHGDMPYILHGTAGARLLREEGFSEEMARIAERHTGAGISIDDIKEMNLPLPLRDYSPETKLERLICYADKFYSKTRLDSIKPIESVRKSMLKHSPSTLERFEKLHDEFSLDK